MVQVGRRVTINQRCKQDFFVKIKKFCSKPRVFLKHKT